MKPRLVVIGTPVKGETTEAYNDSIEALIQAPPPNTEFRLLKSKSGLIKSRDNICAFAMHEGADDVIMWDSDNAAHPADIARLLSHEVDICGVLYTTKDARRPRWVLTPFPHKPRPDRNGLMPVIEIGTGLKRYRVSALRKMAETHPELEYSPADGLFPGARRFHWHYSGVLDRRWISEDFGFDHVAADSGFTIYCDTRIRSAHWGPAPYPLPGMSPVVPGLDDQHIAGTVA